MGGGEEKGKREGEKTEGGGKGERKGREKGGEVE